MSSRGLSLLVLRFEWQVLNTLQETGGASRDQILGVVGTFLDASSFGEIVARLYDGRCIELSSTGDTEQLQLTEEGQRNQEIISATQKQVRIQAMRGITEEEYGTVIRVLQRIVSNLEGS